METTKTKITVETTVNAPIEKVWKMWNGPEHITKWCTASDDWHTPNATNDLREGGKASATMAAKDGSFSFELVYTYTKVKTNEVIEYTMGDGRRVWINFTSQGNSVNIVETFEAEDQNPIEMQQGGWQAILNNFKKYVEQN
jgi:uncharacterized protein YndB with AHSA1/START domain